MKYCPKCGMQLPDDARFCGKCGQPVELTCPVCGRPIVEGTRYCVGCGTDLGAALGVTEKVEKLKEYTTPPPTAPRPAYQYPPQPTKKKSAKPVAAGILLLIAAIIAIINIVISLFAVGSAIQGIPVSQLETIKGILYACFAIVMVLSIFALIGGIMAIRRKMWGLALTGSILGLFTIGPLFICSILSLVALILIAISRDEFAR